MLPAEVPMAQRGGTSLARAGVLLGSASVLSTALGGDWEFRGIRPPKR